MGFKLLGIALLIASAYLVINTLVSGRMLSDTGHSDVYPLIAIVLVLMVRVLQAEKHHRERKQ